METLESLCIRLSEDKNKATYLKKFIQIAVYSEDAPEIEHAIKNIKSIKIGDLRVKRVFSLDNYIIAHLEKEDSTSEQFSVCEIPIEYQGRPYNLQITN